MIETPLSNIVGHIKIRDVATNEILVEKYNAINFENFSVCLAQGAGARPQGYINEMVFGNGAAVVSGVGTVTYLPPNVQGIGAQLYNETYNKVVNDISPLNTNSAKNFIQVIHAPGTVYSDIQITCTLDLGEPAGQYAFDTATDLTTPYVFNELGLKTKAGSVDGGLLISHVIFSPIQKSLNREIEVVYTIRIQAA